MVESEGVHLKMPKVILKVLRSILAHYDFMYYLRDHPRVLY